MRAGVLIAALSLSSLVFTACLDQMTDAPNFRRVPASEARSYVIGPDDLLQIVVWKNESLSRELRVRPDGKITLPLINDIQASGKTPSDLREIISTRLEKFVEVAGVTVIVKEINSSKVSVLGQVRKPGIYPLRSDLTVLDAVAMAEGFNEFAAPDRMVIIRKNGKETHWIKVNYDDILQGRISEDRLFLASGDTLVVP